ncbi:MAG TPA: hypothetical protein VFJ90_10830 [Candidatus Didemnitutus sp.]|nr:hypothetical protein [Candidatus Didemnitutus sp.]
MKIIDIMPVIAPDHVTLAREVRRLLQEGWSRQGPIKRMRPVHDLSKTVLCQMLVLRG